MILSHEAYERISTAEEQEWGAKEGIPTPKERNSQNAWTTPEIKDVIQEDIYH